jgi:citrate lyase subunit beta/citryl-CoA lyase
MTDRVRPAVGPVRSLLFLPGNRQDWIDSALSSGADAIVFDLEDSVPVADIEAARETVRGAIEKYGTSGPRIMVRVGPPGTKAMQADLDAVVRPGVGGIMIPLVSTADEVSAVADRLDELETARGIPLGSTIIMPLIETALAARFSYEIASVSPRIAYMGGGTSRQGDLARSIGYRWTPEGNETLLIRSWALLNVRAAGVPFPITGMWSVVDDLEGLRTFAEHSRGLGYSGLMIIHPSHVDVVNEVFTPSAAEIEQWHETIRVMREAQAQGRGAIRVNGELLDEAHVKTAELGLALVEQIGSLPASN